MALAAAFFSLVISIHALLAESDALEAALYAVAYISIHALLAESDRTAREGSDNDMQRISIHALLAESDGLSFDG